MCKLYLLLFLLINFFFMFFSIISLISSPCFFFFFLGSWNKATIVSKVVSHWWIRFSLCLERRGFQVMHSCYLTIFHKFIIIFDIFCSFILSIVKKSKKYRVFWCHIDFLQLISVLQVRLQLLQSPCAKRIAHTIVMMLVLSFFRHTS